MTQCETNNHTGMYWVRLQNTTAGHTVNFPFISERQFSDWYNGNGEFSSHRINYELLEKGIDMRKRFL